MVGHSTPGVEKLGEEKNGMIGLRLAAIYGFPPSRLGFCGPQGDKNLKSLVEFIGGNDSLLFETRAILLRFEAAYAYYRLIARCNKIADPFDQKVVEAYWFGNGLLDQVKLSDLKQLVLVDFCRPGLLSPKEAKEKAAVIPTKAKPHHSFHVLIIGSVTGRVKFTTKVRDICRIGWGEVDNIKNQKSKIKNSQLEVRTRPLVVRSNRFVLGDCRKREIAWDKRFLPSVEVGDMVSFHWGRACQVLNKREEKNLLKYTLLNIRAVNERRK